MKKLIFTICFISLISSFMFCNISYSWNWEPFGQAARKLVDKTKERTQKIHNYIDSHKDEWKDTTVKHTKKYYQETKEGVKTFRKGYKEKKY